MNIKMADVFTSTTGVCIHVNLSCLHDFRNDGVTPFDMIDKAVSEYDANQALIAKQVERIKSYKNQIAKIIMLHKQSSLGGDASVDALFELADFIELLEATKEQV